MNKYKIDFLSNKMPLISVPLKASPTATILVIVKTGSKYETKQDNGISHFLEHMFFKGTKQHPTALDLSSNLDALGSEYNAFTSKEYTGYWVKVAAPKIKKALHIVGDMLLNSKFEEAEIERERGVIVEEVNMYEDNPMIHVEDVFEECLYGDMPAGWDTIGTKDNIRRFTREDFLNYFTRQYGSKSMFVILAGGFKATDKKVAAEIFAKFPRNAWADKLALREKQNKPQLKIVHKKIDQINLSLGVRAYPVGHAEEFRVKLLSIILGGSMSSRLFINLRERNGLAYSVRSSAEFYSDSGYLTTQAGVPTGKAEAAIKIILAEYKRIAREKVGSKELKRAKDLLAGKVLLQMEATDDIATWYARQAILRKKMLTPQDFLRTIKKISAAQLLATAKKIFVNRGLNLALIGQAKPAELKKILKF